MTITINGTTGIAGVDGSASTPAVQGTDTNTGVFFGTDTVTIATGGTAAVTVDSGQRTKFPTTIGVGGATPSTSGSGISFPATASASSDANTLDDYEEGTWTPALKDGSNNSATMNTQTGYYRKVGSLVYITCNISVARGSLATTDLNITGLPFTSLTSTVNAFPSNYWEALATAMVTITGSLGGNSATMYLRKQASAQVSVVNFTYTDIATSAGNIIQLSGSYIANA